jgi:hypothetical protein
MSRRAKSGVLKTIFTQLQQKQTIAIKIDSVSLDGTHKKCIPTAKAFGLGLKKCIGWKFYN